MGTLIKQALIVQPRWFAAPVLVSSVVLGYVVSAPLSWFVFVPILFALCVMAWGHTMNTVLDYSWTGLDKGLESERSHPKPYTSGQQVIASGMLTARQVFLIAVGWLAVSTIAMIYISIHAASLWVFVFWALSALVTFAYSWGKLHWLCEIALGVGFGPLAALIGAAASPSPDYLASALASIPIFLIFGWGAEAYDQWFDSDTNWDQGLRNIGAWVWHTKNSIGLAVGVIVLATFLAQGLLVLSGILSLWTLLSLPAALSLVLLPQAEKRKPWAVNLLLGAVFYYCIALAVGQVVGG